MINKTPTSIRFTKNQMKIIELLQDKYSNKITKPKVAEVVGFALENLLYTELDELKLFDVFEVEDYIDLITDEGLKNKLKDKHLLIPESQSISIDDDHEIFSQEELAEILKASKNNTNRESPGPLKIEDKPPFSQQELAELAEIFNVSKNDTNSESSTPDPFSVDKNNEENSK